MGVNFQLLDTVVGDRVLNSEAVAAIMQADPQPLAVGALSAASIATTGNTSVGGDETVTGKLSAKYVAGSVATALTAAGTDRATGLQLAAAINNITTAASSTGVVLPASTAVGEGGSVTIYNNGASPIKVYATASETIDGTAGATGVTLTNAKRCLYTVIGGVWISAQLGVVSA